MIIDFTVENFRSISDSQTISFLADGEHHLDDVLVWHATFDRT